RLLLVYGLLLLCALLEVESKRRDPPKKSINNREVTTLPPHEHIVAPGPDEDLQTEELKPLDDEFYLENDVNICENMVDGAMLPFVGKCSKYIYCNQSEIEEIGDCESPWYKEHLCAKGDYDDCHIAFNYRTQLCVYAHTTECLPKCDPEKMSSFCYDRTCSKYVLCFYGVPVLRQCFDGLQYNAETDRCDYPQYVDCVENHCNDQATPENINYLPSKAHCGKYYVCSEGTTWAQRCTEGLIFNPNCNCCDYPSNYKCSITAEQRNIKSFARAPPRRADITCPDSGHHYFAHKRRSDAYYYCSNGRGVTLDCTPGLVYDAKVHECREAKFIAL
ncbi:CG10154, partial [Drosophila busckii]